MAERLIDPRADARDARFLEWLMARNGGGLPTVDAKPVWDASWQAAVDWLRKDSGR